METKNNQFVLFKTYPVCYFSGQLGPKRKQGDHQAPEGSYKVTKKQLQPFSAYRLAIDIGYPNQQDRIHHATGDHIMIHGGCESSGCFAMTDPYMDEIYTLFHHALKHQKSIDINIYPTKKHANKRLTIDTSV